MADDEPGDGPWLVVGLGNPGTAYAGNRHNAGRMLVDLLASRWGLSFKRHGRAHAMVAEGRIRPGGPRVVLAAPLSYMNDSGGPVSQLAKFYGVPPQRVIVAHDEIDLPFSALRLKQGGGHAGQNGVRDIIAALGTPDFLRIRLGVGRPPGSKGAADYVLRDFAPAERADRDLMLELGGDAVETIIESGLVTAQQRFHSPA